MKPLSSEEKNKLSSTSAGRNELERIKMDRRNFLKLGAATVILASKGGVNADIPSNSKNTPSKSEAPKPAEVIFKIDDANKILNLDPGSADRDTAEHKYTNEVLALNNLRHLDQTFWFVSNTEDRVRLLEKRNEFREKGMFNLRQLTPDEKKFCKENNFHEEWVAICIDSHIKTKEILQKTITAEGGMINFIQKFRPDLENLIKEKKIDPKTIILDDIMLPVGALIGIAWSESKTITKDGKIHALVDIGKVPSINYITVEDVKNEKGIVDKMQTAKNLETVKQKMRKLYEILSVNSVKYIVDKVPGSDKTGDIGSLQFRPDTVLDFINFCKDKDIDFTFNPSGLEAATAACLMLSIGQRLPEGDYRAAYINGKEEGNPFYKHMIKSFQRWNSSLVDNILFWRKKYTIKPD